ncbi:hypothetical protein DWV44_05430 [Lachnospira eligens]|nr:hypothetical protein DWV44_05430 [Lachnospira eligens]
MLKPVRLLAECYDKHFAFLIYEQLKAIIDRLHTPMRNDFKVKNWYGYWLDNSFAGIGDGMKCQCICNFIIYRYIDF